MYTLNTLENSISSILYEIPAGKPDPTQICPKENDKRDRVFQSASKGNSCWYYVYNYIRKRIGKNPCAELKEAREIEVRCSALRKTLDKQKFLFPFVICLITDEEMKDTLQKIDMKQAKSLIQNWKIVGPKLESPARMEKYPGHPTLLLSLKEFIEQNSEKNLYDFLFKKMVGMRSEANLKFLNSFGVDPQKEYENLINPKNGYIEGVEFQKLTDLGKASFIECFVRQLCAKKYGLQISKWMPLKGIDLLITQLKEQGPMAIGGMLGKSFYVDSPFKMSQKIGGRDIYAWKPGAKRVQMGIICHQALLIGAKKVGDKAYAYFIDPNDSSDPKDISKQQIYMISYENLVKSLCDLNGSFQPTSPSSIGYALHGNFQPKS